jgi:hypothetical protein
MKRRRLVGIANLFRKNVSKDSFVISWLAAHKNISRWCFSKFRTTFHYENELDELLSFKETEYLVFWFIRRHLNDATLFGMYDKFLETNQISTDKFAEQLEIRYRIYDNALREFTENAEGNPSKQGLQIGQILIKSIGNLDLMKSGSLGDGLDGDITKVFKASTIWIEGIKMIDGVVGSAEHKYRIEPFLRKQ